MDIIFDIDGTLANCDHRRHWVQNKPYNWGAFNAAAHLDTLNEDIAYLLWILAEENRIAIVTGRSEEMRELTVNWLKSRIIFKNVDYHTLRMRPAKDSRSDVIIKGEILDQLILEGWDPKMVFDDRDGVVEMWRSRGIRCLQVAKGDF